VPATFIAAGFSSCLGCQANGELRNLFLSLAAAAGKLFNCPATAIPGCEIHPGVNPGRIAAQQQLHPAELLKDLPPVKLGQLPQTGKGIAAGQLFPGLPVLLTENKVVERAFEHPLQPALDRRQCGLLVVEQTDQLDSEIRAGVRFCFGKFRQNREKLVGIAAIGGNQAVCPEIC